MQGDRDHQESLDTEQAMKTTTCLCILAFLLLPTARAAGGQATSSTGFLHAEIQKVYDFHPHTLSSAQIDQKSASWTNFGPKQSLSVACTSQSSAASWRTSAIRLFSSLMAASSCCAFLMLRLTGK